MVRDHYELLGVDSSATADEIRAAHRRRMRALAGSKHAPDSTEAVMLEEALAVLTDPVRRTVYDRLATPSQVASPPATTATTPAPAEEPRQDVPRPVPPPPAPPPSPLPVGGNGATAEPASRGLVAAGIAAGLVLVVLVAALVAGWVLLRDSGNVFDLAVGTCFNNTEAALGATELVEVPVVDCSEPHDNEVYAAFDMTEAEFPGPEATDQIAFDECVDRFDTFVGTAWENSELDFTYLYPSAASWNQGDREIVCAIHRPDGERTTGSLEGAGI